jgi:osmotically-inducible protein OsmY
MSSVRWASVFLLLAAFACDRGRDTAHTVRKALDDANMHRVQVEVDDAERIVHLQGSVNTMADRTRADEIANAVVGTSGRVVNDLTVEDLVDRRPNDVDGKLTDAVDERLDGDPVLRERDVNIAVTDGVVSVSGEVRSQDEKRRVDRIVTSVAGVRSVANHLQVRSEP